MPYRTFILSYDVLFHTNSTTYDTVQSSGTLLLCISRHTSSVWQLSTWPVPSQGPLPEGLR